MKLKSARLAQQLRLWIYTALMLLVVVRAFGGRLGLLEFVMFMLVGLPFYLEVCPVC